MAHLQMETVDKLIDLLSLPVGENEQDARPPSMESDVQRVSQDLGWLVFEDDKWYAYEPSRIDDVLAVWLDEHTAAQLETAARESQPAQFLEWIEQLVQDWKTAESGAAGPLAEGAEAELLGIENPYFEPDQVPGTEFYKYVDDTYVYAATSDAPPDEWKDLETRYDEYRALAPPAAEDDGMLRGYPYASCVLPGTEYYRLEDGEYLYGPEEYGPADAWQLYEYWQDRADEADSTARLIHEIDTFIALLHTRGLERAQSE